MSNEAGAAAAAGVVEAAGAAVVGSAIGTAAGEVTGRPPAATAPTAGCTVAGTRGAI